MPFGPNIKQLCSALSVAILSAAPAQAIGLQELLSGFDFETGEIAISPPQGMSPDRDWSIGFVVTLGDRQASSAPISLDWRGVSTDALPDAAPARTAYVLKVADGWAADAAETMLQYRQISDMTADEDIDVSMQLSAGFHIDETQAVNICYRQAPAPMDVWVKPSEDADWRKFADARSDSMLAHFVSSALQAACPKTRA